MTKVVEKSQFHSLGLYYSNLFGRAINAYNDKGNKHLGDKESLLVFNNIKDIDLTHVKEDNLVVLLLRSGGALPYRIGSWECQKDLIGSMYSLAIYKKVYKKH